MRVYYGCSMYEYVCTVEMCTVEMCETEAQAFVLDVHILVSYH